MPRLPTVLWGLLAALATLAALSSSRELECEVSRSKTPWITAVVSSALADYVPAGTSACTRDGKIYAESLTNLTFWATKMYDASSQGLSPGVLEGRNFDYGHFEECVSAGSPALGIRGRYMVAQLTFEPAPETYPNFYTRTNVFREPQDYASAWEVLKPTGDRRISPRNVVSWAVCVPSSCSEQDVEVSLAEKLAPALNAHHIQGNLTVLREYTYSRADPVPAASPLHYIFLCVTVILFALLLAATIYDVTFLKFEDNVSSQPWFVDFSLRRTWDDLFKQPKNEFSVMSGFKAISMFMIIYGHRMMISVSSPQVNPNNIQMAGGRFTATYVENGTLVVNTFMVITGFLTFYKITKDLYNNRDLRVWRSICNRFMRLTPAYLFVMCVQYFIFPQIEGGPMSRAVVWDPNTFGSYWWTHLTYINNYIMPTSQCLIPSWYVAFDMQMYVFAYLLGGMLQKARSLTPYLLSLATVASLAAPALTVAYTKYWGTYLIFFTTIKNHFYDPQFQALYMPTHIRASPYIIGMFGGYIYYHLKDKKITFSSKTLWTWAILSTIVFNLSICWALPFYVPGRPYVLWENVAYSFMHRLGWGLVIVWIIIASSIGRFRPYRFFLGQRVYEPFNKLTYSALLVHTLVQIYMVGYIRSPVNYGRIMGIWMACGDIALTYFFSVILYCLVESPFSKLQQRIWDISIFKDKEETDVKK